MEPLDRIRQNAEQNAEKAQAQQRHNELLSASLQTQNVITDAIAQLVGYLSDRVSRTEVVNQLREIGTPDVASVVEAVDRLRGSQMAGDEEVTSILRKILESSEREQIVINADVRYKGDYSEGTAYATGDGVTFDGSYYVAKQQTKTIPTSNKWQLVISKGEKGESVTGETGKDGADGKDGKDGRTPVKGVDYTDGKDGRDGKDGKDGKPGNTGPKGEKGDQGERGPRGQQGPVGAPGKGIAYGGITGQVLAKVSDYDFDTQWVNQSSGGGGAWGSITGTLSSQTDLQTALDARINDTGDNFTGSVGILATSGSPTHSLTLGSTATGIALYNTSDQTTNYERTLLRYESNVFVIRPERGGTGGVRTMSFQVGDTPRLNLTNGGGTTGYIQLTSNFSINTTSPVVSVNGTLNGSSSTNYGAIVQPTINQSGTANYTALLVNPTETATGSGSKLLLDLQVGSSSKFRVDNTGIATSNHVIFSNNPVSVTSNAGTCSAGYYLNTFTNSSAATMAITLSTSGVVDGQRMIVRIYDFSAAAQTIGWTNTENSTISVPTTSNGSTTLPLTVGFMYNSATSKWRCVGVA